MAYLHVYTGNGKGKTTAAFGVALRAVCAGWPVYVGQFVKGMVYNEARCGEQLPGILVEQLGRTCILSGEPAPEDHALAEAGLARAATLMAAGTYRLVILDELTIALHLKLLTLPAVLEALAARHPDTEVIITGRYAPQALLDAADLVTEMVEVKHYYQQGVLSRPGIDC